MAEVISNRRRNHSTTQRTACRGLEQRWQRLRRDQLRIADASRTACEIEPETGRTDLDLSTGTGWTSRVVAKRGATVIGSTSLDCFRRRAQADGTARDRIPRWRCGVAPISRRELTRWSHFGTRSRAVRRLRPANCSRFGLEADWLTTWTSDSNSSIEVWRVWRRHPVRRRARHSTGPTDRSKRLSSAFRCGSAHVSHEPARGGGTF